MHLSYLNDILIQMNTQCEKDLSSHNAIALEALKQARFMLSRKMNSLIKEYYIYKMTKNLMDVYFAHSVAHLNFALTLNEWLI